MANITCYFLEIHFPIPQFPSPSLLRRKEVVVLVGWVEPQAKPNNQSTVGAISESRLCSFPSLLRRINWANSEGDSLSWSLSNNQPTESQHRYFSLRFPTSPRNAASRDLPGFSLTTAYLLQETIQFHSKNFKILEFCSLILLSSQHSCPIRSCKILELKNTFFQITVKNCETSKLLSVNAADLFLVTFWLPRDANGCPFHAGSCISTEVTIGNRLHRLRP